MKNVLSLAALLLLAGSAAAQDAPAPPTNPAPPADRQAASRESSLLDFQYRWPDSLSGDPKLIELLKADLAKSYDQGLADARENNEAVQKYGGTFNQNLFVRVWTVEGQTDRLTSLVGKTDTYTGGAHPNHASQPLLWDRTSGAQVKLADLFADPAAFEAAIRPDYCKKLDAERLKKREGQKLEGEFSKCPAFTELTIAPAASKGSKQFDSIELIADPYVAGPYVEGDYAVSLPVSAAVIAALKPEYRASFQAQRPQ